jgi:hypothetical protein
VVAVIGHVLCFYVSASFGRLCGRDWMEAVDIGDVRIDWWCQKLGCWLLKVRGRFGGDARRAEIVREMYSGSFLFRSLIACRNAEYWGVCGREKCRMECGMSVFRNSCRSCGGAWRNHACRKAGKGGGQMAKNSFRKSSC